jgi:hypothetical protein
VPLWQEEFCQGSETNVTQSGSAMTYNHVIPFAI